MQQDHSPRFVEHFNNPRNVGSLDASNLHVGTGVATVSDCGDVMRLQIQADKSGRISRATFKTFGCSAAIAAGSVTTEWLIGRSLAEAEAFDGETVTDELSLAPDKQHSSRLAEQAVRRAIADLKKSHRCPAEQTCGPR